MTKVFSWYLAIYNNDNNVILSLEVSLRKSSTQRAGKKSLSFTKAL